MQSMILRNLDADASSGVLFDSDVSLAGQRFAPAKIGASDAQPVRGLVTRVAGTPCVLYLEGDRPVFRAGTVSCAIRPGVSSRFEAGPRKHSFELRVGDEVVFSVAYARAGAGLKNLLLDLLDTRDDVLSDGMSVMDTFINRPELLADALAEASTPKGNA